MVATTTGASAEHVAAEKVPVRGVMLEAELAGALRELERARAERGWSDSLAAAERQVRRYESALAVYREQRRAAASAANLSGPEIPPAD
jgi:hypothetical protein